MDPISLYCPVIDLTNIPGLLTVVQYFSCMFVIDPAFVCDIVQVPLLLRFPFLESKNKQEIFNDITYT